MQLTEVTFNDQLPIDAYGPGFFRVAEQIHQGPMLLDARGVAAWGGYEDVETLFAAADGFDILFIGTGAEIAPLPAALRQHLDDAGIAAEVMASPSACRTYNILLSEGRRVAIAVLPV